MANSYEAEIKYPKGIEIASVIKKTLDVLGWKYMMTKVSTFDVLLPETLTSFGFKIIIQICPPDKINIKSSLARYGITDWGRNKKNVDLFEWEVTSMFKQLSQNSVSNIPINSEDFTTKLVKNHKLYTSQIISLDEFNHFKDEIISDLKNQTLTIDKEDFLVSLIDLRNSSIISDADLIKIKNVIFSQGEIYGATQK